MPLCLFSMTSLPLVVVGISGGVDSSVAALLLKQQAYQVEALFMKNWEEEDNDKYCAASQDFEDAQAVCAQLDIPLHTVNFAQHYWDKVFSYCLNEFSLGRTPNPDILCNRYIKFAAFLDHAKKLGAAYIATGHYAKRIIKNEQYYLCPAKDLGKDQSYFLYTLNQQQLAHTLFPLAEITKSAVRAIAKQADLITHAKRDSTGICFIGKRRFKEFLSRYLPAQPGLIQDLHGNTIGQHDGLMYYTLGQRQGLNIGGQRGANHQAWYVIAKDLTNNILRVAQGHEHPALYRQSLTCQQIHWIAEHPPANLQCSAKIRYRQTDQQCYIHILNQQELAVEFSEPQWAITPGQSIVFYQGGYCLGGGIIQDQ